MVEIEIMSMNMARRNAAMHTLLNMDTPYSLILVQEPWFSRIGTARSDGNPDGESILGGVAPLDGKLSTRSFRRALPPKS